MTPLPVVLVPGLLCTAEFYAPALAALWRHGAVTVANHALDDSMAAIARRVLAEAPPRFALAGHSMGGYVALEILRQAPGRVAKLALLDTTARPDTPEQSERRRKLLELAAKSGVRAVADLLFPLTVHASRREDAALLALSRRMADDVGADGFPRQQAAIIGRADSRPLLPAIRCPTLVLVGDGDELIPPDRSQEMAAAIPGARLVLVPGCGHMCLMERPAETTRALADWLAA